MPKAPAQVIGDGRVTIPANIRRKIGIEKGDYVIIDIQPVEWTDKGGQDA